MLCLQRESNPEWIGVASENLDRILVDHAHCEKKAATFALAMVNRYPHHERLVADMVDLAIEELEHFRIVMGELRKRNIPLSPMEANPYAQQLHDHVRTSEPERLLDLLIVGAFIEARSCERFSLLAAHAPNEELKSLYSSLLASEAGHYRAYTDIAREYCGNDVVRARLQEFAIIESNIVANLPNQPTMHG